MNPSIPNTMKALVKAHPKEGLWLQEIPVPGISHNEVLIKILKTAICGTDVHIYNWDTWSQKNVPVPMHIGHEFVGRVVAVGSHVKDCSPGDLVSGGKVTSSAATAETVLPGVVICAGIQKAWVSTGPVPLPSTYPSRSPMCGFVMKKSPWMFLPVLILWEMLSIPL